MANSKFESSTDFAGQHFNFGPFSLRADGTLLRDGEYVALSPKELAILRLLVAKAGQIVLTEDLRQAAWGSVHVSPDSLPRCVSSLRAHLDLDSISDGESGACIQTVYKRGYRFNLPVVRPSASPDGSLPRLATELRALPRMVILPFATNSGVPAFLGAGIAEETMVRLARSRVPVVDVMARDSVFSLAARGVGAVEAARTLHADLALSGSVTALPLHFRLRAEMVRTADAVQLWVEDFLVPRTLLAYADARMAKRISARIRETFATAIPMLSSPAQATPEGTVRGSARSGIRAVVSIREAERSEAYSTFLQASAQWATFQQAQMQDAVRGFQTALDLDPELSSARIQLMHGYLALATFGYLRGDMAAEQARRQAHFLLGQHSGEGMAGIASEQSAQAALGWIHFFHDRDPGAAATAFTRPHYTGYNPWKSVYHARFALGQGRYSDAVSLLKSGLESDPYSPVLHWRLVWALHLMGDTQASIAQARRTIALFPNDPGALFFCSIVFAAAIGSDSRHRNNRGAESELAAQSVVLATKLVQYAPALDSGYATLAYAQARQGNIVEAHALLDRQKWMGRDRFVMRSFQAPALVELGEYDAALEALTAAEQQHCPWLFELLGDPRLQPLHGESEFQRLTSLSGHTMPSQVSVA